MVSDDGEQVPETALDFLDASRELGQPCRKLRKPLLLSRLENISLLPALDGL
jgi:hypothetical protein